MKTKIEKVKEILSLEDKEESAAQLDDFIFNESYAYEIYICTKIIEHINNIIRNLSNSNNFLNDKIVMDNKNVGNINEVELALSHLKGVYENRDINLREETWAFEDQLKVFLRRSGRNNSKIFLSDRVNYKQTEWLEIFKIIEKENMPLNWNSVLEASREAGFEITHAVRYVMLENKDIQKDFDEFCEKEYNRKIKKWK